MKGEGFSAFLPYNLSFVASLLILHLHVFRQQLSDVSPKPSDVRPKPSDAHQKVSDAHQKAADGKHEDEESATKLQKMAFKEEMPRTLHPSLFECKLFSVSALYG